MTNLRYLAAKIVDEVTEGKSLTERLEHYLPNISNSRDKAFIQAITFGVCRLYTRLDIILSHLLDRPMNANDVDLHALCLVGLFQLLEMRVPQHAAVAETVAAVEKFKKPWAKGLVNAVLRKFTREQSQIMQTIADDIEAKFAHPLWWIKRIQQDYPNQWEAILNANNEHPPLALRVNRLAIARDDYLAAITAKDLAAQPLLDTPCGLILDKPMPAESIPGLVKGEVSIQDGSGQLVATVLELADGMRVLDACAAPGGKLAALVEANPTITMVGVEKDKQRIKPIQENIKRLNLTKEKIEIINQDVKATGWRKDQLFDRILVDAPCSASGVIRRHPDIKLLRQPEDLPMFAKEQLAILTSLWPLLRPGGKLIYATCSIFKIENTDVMQAFLAKHANAREDEIKAEWGQKAEIGRQLLPGMHHMDGFYYARVQKLAAPN